MTETDNLQMWSLIVGFLSPIVLAIIQQPTWKRPLRAFVTFVWALLAGAGTAYFTGDFNGRSFVTCVLIVMVTTISTYVGFWKRTGIAPGVEGATSGRGSTSTESGTAAP